MFQLSNAVTMLPQPPIGTKHGPPPNPPTLVEDEEKKKEKTVIALTAEEDLLEGASKLE